MYGWWSPHVGRLYSAYRPANYGIQKYTKQNHQATGFVGNTVAHIEFPRSDGTRNGLSGAALVSTSWASLERI